MTESPSKPRPARIPRWAMIAAALLMLAGLGLRGIGMGREGLWIDEIFSASFTNLSLFETVVACLRFDVHPPLHYLQLNVWSTLGHDDTWLTLNSVFWGMLTLVLVFVTTARRFGPVSGLIALAFCAAMGSEIYFANEVRAYTMLGALMLLSWIAADRLLDNYRFRTALPLIVSLIVVGGLHSFGVIALSGALLYALPYGDGRNGRALLPTWLQIAVLVGIGVAPWVINASLRHVGHLGSITFTDVIYTVSGWILGYRAIAIAEWIQVAVSLLIALMLLVAAIRVPRLRRMIFCFIIWPLLIAGLVSVAWKPIWLFRPFSFCAPFLAITLGALLGQVTTGPQRAGSIVIRGMTVILTVCAVIAGGWISYRQSVTPWKTQYREAAAYLRTHVRSDEIVYIPDQIAFWGIARYLVGPQWGSVLKVQDPLNQDRSAIWPHIYERLGAGNLERLHLKPETRRVDGFRAPLFIGWSPLQQAQHAGVIWVAGSAGMPYDFHLDDVALCPHQPPEVVEFTEVRVFRITCNTTVSAVASREPTVR